MNAHTACQRQNPEQCLKMLAVWPSYAQYLIILLKLCHTIDCCCTHFERRAWLFFSGVQVAHLFFLSSPVGFVCQLLLLVGVLSIDTRNWNSEIERLLENQRVSPSSNRNTRTMPNPTFKPVWPWATSSFSVAELHKVEDGYRDPFVTCFFCFHLFPSNSTCVTFDWIHWHWSDPP